MHLLKRLTIALATIAVCASTLPARQIAPFKDGERAVFLGNSITDGGHYHSYIWLYYMTRFPEMPITVVNAGIGGDTALEMNRRLDNDVFSHDPTVLMVTFGMNDSGYFEHEGENGRQFAREKYDESISNFRHMEQRLKALPDTRIVMVGTSPFDEEAVIPASHLRGKAATIERIVATQLQTATDNGWEQIDFCAPMTEINRTRQATDSTFTLCGADRIHPDNDGHMVMAYLFLKAQGFAGNKVADVAINARKPSVTREENCSVTDLRKNGNGITFNYLANALPYPVDTVARGWEMRRPQSQALDIVPFTEEMNREMLTVTGLKGDYKLTIDGEEIGVWSADSLAKGINLAEITLTPQYQQALAVMFLNERRWEIERQFREYAWVQNNFFEPKGLLNANNRHAIEVMDQYVDSDPWLKIRRDRYAQMMNEPVRKAMEDEMKMLVDRIYTINKPVVRRFELRRILPAPPAPQKMQ